MIALLKGKIIQKREDSAILDVSGVGYLVSIPATELGQLAAGQDVTLNTYLVVKEDALDLYGSKDAKVLDWFRLLLSVKGIGPKSALSIVSAARPQDLSVAIHTESPEALVSVGVGKKPAERIVLELKNKAKDLIEADSVPSSGSIAIDAEALQALEALGYSREQARDALKESQGDDVETKVRNALKSLSK
ncbi:MAG: Holliday junction branch migration protein RuvA [Patescibacteria group bacterium]|jgi:Holliday junction DNA helicase RuvA|nr:Holliday junction branch migration protein RuvA [Patescibacteria group bacterium]|tara:strand:- start:239 stop:811 length:573 start_codon:yes stop_codon:yes gene_type:complete